MMHISTLLFVNALIIASVNGWLFSKDHSKWDGLRAKWGFNVFKSFRHLPRTKAEAEDGGWEKYDSSTNCTANPHFLGERYWKNTDLAVILVYGPNGYIAGIQAGIRNVSNPNNYPSEYLRGSPFILENDIYFITAYFVNPSKVCMGRTEAQFNADGTGTGLWIQNGTDPVRDSITIPMTQQEADDSTWTEGSCFITMGVHYWYNTSLDMDCNRFYPVFLLYNGGQLNAFGWAFGQDITTSPDRFEHPPQGSYRNFLKKVPRCLENFGTLTTQHIYLSNSWWDDRC